jgi:Lipase (class 3)
MDPAEMLTLAAITYRGCEFNLSNPNSRKIVYDEIRRCLKTFRPVPGKWELVWGPAGYRTGNTGTDDSAMYVVRGTQERSALAIVIRGTNFFSLPDWTSNLLIDPKPWQYGRAADDVKISHSTSRGLSTLQLLRSGPIMSVPIPQSPVEQMEAAETAAEAGLAYDLLKKIFEGTSTFNGVEYLAEIFKRMSTHTIVDLLATDDDADLPNNVEDAYPASASTNTLLEFLKGFVAGVPAPVDVYVVGHSKGGALAAALALWLVDTQGGAVAHRDQWDPITNAKVHLYSFAAPTAGNAGFASRFTRKITSAYRLANPYDLVPHVWNPDDVREIPTLYGSQLNALRLPADALALALQITAYQHEVSSARWTGPSVAQSNFLQRAGVEHLDSYLKQFGLYDVQTLSTLALFAPVN